MQLFFYYKEIALCEIKALVMEVHSGNRQLKYCDMGF